MTFFEQIIFPQLEKKIIPSEKELTYWFQYIDDSVVLMVECPVCQKEYQYSVLLDDVTIFEITNGIENSSCYFLMEWELRCPDADKHAAILKKNNRIKCIESAKEAERIMFEWSY